MTPTAAQALEALECLMEGKLVTAYAMLRERTIRQHIESAAAELATLRAECERQTSALAKIKAWADAYPEEVFPEPDLKRAHELLYAVGMSLDSISAHITRDVLTKVQKIVDAALNQGGEG